jgi:predicted GIY-YIG superfamily endonuclease
LAFYVYVLRCRDGSYYVGHTDNIENRLAAHHSGAIPDCYTHDLRPVELVICQEFQTRQEAFERERQVKGWSRAKKEALIAGKMRRLEVLSRNYADVERLRQAQSVNTTGPSAGSG